MKQYTLTILTRCETGAPPAQMETTENLWSLVQLVEWSPEELDQITNLEPGQRCIFSDFAVLRLS